jgi:hypothetical protein
MEAQVFSAAKLGKVGKLNKLRPGRKKFEV